MDIGKFGWLLVALVAYSGGFVIGAPGYGNDDGSYLDAPMPSLSKPLASEGVEAKESAPQAEAVRDDAMSQQQLKKAFGKHMKMLDKIDRTGNDEDLVPWAMSWMQSASAVAGGERKVGV